MRPAGSSPGWGFRSSTATRSSSCGTATFLVRRRPRGLDPSERSLGRHRWGSVELKPFEHANGEFKLPVFDGTLAMTTDVNAGGDVVWLAAVSGLPYEIEDQSGGIWRAVRISDDGWMASGAADRTDFRDRRRSAVGYSAGRVYIGPCNASINDHDLSSQRTDQRPQSVWPTGPGALRRHANQRRLDFICSVDSSGIRLAL